MDTLKLILSKYNIDVRNYKRMPIEIAEMGRVGLAQLFKELGFTKGAEIGVKAEDFEDESLDFVFIDGNHDFEYVVEDICKWTKKVRKGGIVSGHDYVKMRNGRMHIVQAVNAYTWSYGITTWFTVGVKTQREHRIDDQIRSWFFVK